MKFCLAVIFLLTARVALGEPAKAKYESWLSLGPTEAVEQRAATHLTSQPGPNSLNAELKSLNCGGAWTHDPSPTFGPAGSSARPSADSEPTYRYSSDNCKIIETDITPVEACPSGTRAVRVKTSGYKICVKLSESGRRSATHSSNKSGS